MRGGQGSSLDGLVEERLVQPTWRCLGCKILKGRLVYGVVGGLHVLPHLWK